MDSVPIKYLDQLKTISAVKVLIAFLSKKSATVEYSITNIAKDTGLSLNAIRGALVELDEVGLIKSVGKSKERTTVYLVVLESEPTKTEPIKNEPTKIEHSEVDSKWEKATAARKKRGKKEEKEVKELNNNIFIDFNNINYYTEDINSLSIVNPNIYMTDEELGKLAYRVVREKFAPVARGVKPSHWFPAQMKLMKDLLVEWRTEQVLAAIDYWTKVNPPDSGLVSLRFLLFKDRNGTSKLMEALDHFKAEYIQNFAHENAREELEKKKQEAIQREIQEQEKLEQEQEKVNSMSDDDFVSNFLGGLGTISIKGRES